MSKTTNDKNPKNDITAFDRSNYMFIIGGVVLLIIGYLLMIGGGAETPTGYNPEIFNFQRITLSPIILLIGFGVVLYGIMKRPKNS